MADLRILKRECGTVLGGTAGADFFRGGGGRWGVAQRLNTARGRDGVGAGGGRSLPLRESGGFTPRDFFICECPYVHF